MKKNNVLLSMVFIIAMASGMLAAKARINHVVYIHSPTSPVGVCDFAVTGRSFVANFNGVVFATTIAGGLCQQGNTFEMVN